MGLGSIVIFVVVMIVSLIISQTLKSKFKKYSAVPMNYGMTGKDVAEKMLRDNGIYDVTVLAVEGSLTDHYNPANKTVNLSRDVYYGNHISAAAVAAHECGHAVQHAHAYSFLKMRTALVPIQNVSATIMNLIFTVLFFGSLFVHGMFAVALPVIIVCYGVFTLFAFITLPVEINASSRALVWLNNAGITSYDTHPKAQDALRWAAYTYVVAALGSLAMLLYYIMAYLGNRD
ncbi:MAG TPA: zinc metallopeptidase [Bacteroidales bacterium]|nr:zinc metallopeptidase [Bacteroidales bacterium]